jgi:hypothetical protein
MDSIRVRAELLPVGISLWQPVRDEQGRVLLKAGSPVTAELKQSLAGQNVEWVLLHPDDALQVMGVGEEALTGAPAKTETPKRVPQRPLPPEDRIDARVDGLARTASLTVNITGRPLQERVVAKGTDPYDPRQLRRLTEQFATAKNLLDSLINEAMAGTARDSQGMYRN